MLVSQHIPLIKKIGTWIEKERTWIAISDHHIFHKNSKESIYFHYLNLKKGNKYLKYPKLNNRVECSKSWNENFGIHNLYLIFWYTFML